MKFRTLGVTLLMGSGLALTTVAVSPAVAQSSPSAGCVGDGTVSDEKSVALDREAAFGDCGSLSEKKDDEGRDAGDSDYPDGFPGNLPAILPGGGGDEAGLPGGGDHLGGGGDEAGLPGGGDHLGGGGDEAGLPGEGGGGGGPGGGGFPGGIPSNFPGGFPGGGADSCVEPSNGGSNSGGESTTGPSEGGFGNTDSYSGGGSMNGVSYIGGESTADPTEGGESGGQGGGDSCVKPTGEPTSKPTGGPTVAPTGTSTVAPVGAATPPRNQRGLPFTGVETGALAAIAVALVGGGFLVRVAARKRQGVTGTHI